MTLFAVNDDPNDIAFYHVIPSTSAADKAPYEVKSRQKVSKIYDDTQYSLIDNARLSMDPLIFSD